MLCRCPNRDLNDSLGTKLTGEAGDVILLHPFMVCEIVYITIHLVSFYLPLQPHSASKNHRRIPRFITNPPVTLKEPLNLNRDNPDQYVWSSMRN